MKIYILGVGGVGGFFGGLLAKSGLDVTFIARGENYKVLKVNGLSVKSVSGNFEIKPVQVIERISAIKNPDLIVFSVKTYDTVKVAKELMKVVNSNTIILTFQNGVENDTEIKKIITHARVYPGLAYVITAKTKPGLIEQTGGLGKLIFGDRDNRNNPRLQEIEKMMLDAHVNAINSDDITKDIWNKFLLICPFAGLTALHQKTIGEILSDPVTKRQYEDCLMEAIMVAKAKGVNLSADVFEVIMKTSLSTAPHSKSSLLLDIENNRRNEIETLNGTLVKFAKELKIKVPINELIYTTIKKQIGNSHLN